LAPFRNPLKLALNTAKLFGMDTLFDLLNERAGGQSQLARRLGVTPPAILDWRRRGQIPAERVLAISRITGLSPNLLRPDLYPDPTWVPPDQAA
jgi:DNA-binding transcriptional regulator YdaS (Cro superfamily)